MSSHAGPKGYFITGIGTGVGKTFVTAALAWQLRQAGIAVRALKPVITGYAADGRSDTAILALAQSLHPTAEGVVDALSPWRFAAPLSPHLAAEREGRRIDADALLDWCRAQLALPGVTLIEGAGGAMVPLNRERLLIDCIAALPVEAILVGASYLGAINHTLLSLEALQRRGIKVRALVVSQSAAEDAGLEETADAIRSFHPALVLRTLPRGTDSAWKEAPDLLSLIDGF